MNNLKIESFRNVAFGAILVSNEFRETLYQSPNLLLKFSKISKSCTLEENSFYV